MLSNLNVDDLPQTGLQVKVPYLLVYKSTSCISRPPIFKVKNRISHHFGKTNEIHTDRNFPKRQFFLPENVLKTP